MIPGPATVERECPPRDNCPMKLGRGCEGIATAFLLLATTASCQETKATAPHYVVVSASWGACEYVTKQGASEENPNGVYNRLQRCAITASLRNDGGDNTSPFGELMLFRAYNTKGNLEPES